MTLKVLVVGCGRMGWSNKSNKYKNVSKNILPLAHCESVCSINKLKLVGVLDSSDKEAEIPVMIVQ